MSDKQPMQADGAGTQPIDAEGKGGPAPRPGGDEQTGESGGGAYPNPHSGKDGSPDGPDRFMGHGGQTSIDYTGPGEDGSEGGGRENEAAGTD